MRNTFVLGEGVAVGEVLQTSECWNGECQKRNEIHYGIDGDEVKFVRENDWMT